MDKEIEANFKIRGISFFFSFYINFSLWKKNNFLYAVLKEVEMCFNETTDANVNNEDISDQFQFVSRDSFFV